MAFSRTAALRSALRMTRPTKPAFRPQLWRQIARRGYASEGHGSHQAAGGDTAWAIGAVAVTIPSCWWLLSNQPDASHGHEDHGEDHGKSHDDDEVEEPKDESQHEDDKSEGDSDDKTDDKEDGDDSEKSEGSDSEDSKDTPETSEDEDDGDSKRDGNTVKSIPDAKGGNKKRIESNKAIKLGEASGDEDSEDQAASSKPAGGKNSQSGKQEGLSNTDTKHSTDIANDPSKSKKGEGMPETAKSKGTVDPNRPQPESK